MSSRVEASPSLGWWDARRGRIVSRAGGWRMGVDVRIRGRRLYGELFPEVSYMQVVVLNATGRLIEPALARWFEASAIGLSWPDSRLWCNHVGALAGTARVSVAPGTIAGALAADSHLYGGGRNYVRGMAFIREALALHRTGVSVPEIMARCKHREGKPVAMGYARPVGGYDERLGPMLRLQEQLGLAAGPHQELAFAIDAYLREAFDGGMNIAGYIAAFLVDRGFDALDTQRIRCLATASGITACHADTSERPAGAYLPLRCDDIEYVGPPHRDPPTRSAREPSV